MSYDDPGVLARFAEKRGITYPLLSDPGSRTIDAYGIRNHEAHGRFDGIPYPGTVIVDAKGVIRAKLFYDGYKKRHEAADILGAARAIDAAAGPADPASH